MSTREQFVADHPFYLPDLPADIGLRDAEFSGGGTETPQSAHRLEQAKMGKHIFHYIRCHNSELYHT